MACSACWGLHLCPPSAPASAQPATSACSVLLLVHHFPWFAGLACKHGGAIACTVRMCACCAWLATGAPGHTSLRLLLDKVGNMQGCWISSILLCLTQAHQLAARRMLLQGRMRSCPVRTFSAPSLQQMTGTSRLSPGSRRACQACPQPSGSVTPQPHLLHLCCRSEGRLAGAPVMCRRVGQGEAGVVAQVGQGALRAGAGAGGATRGRVQAGGRTACVYHGAACWTASHMGSSRFYAWALALAAGRHRTSSSSASKEQLTSGVLPMQ